MLLSLGPPEASQSHLLPESVQVPLYLILGMSERKKDGSESQASQGRGCRFCVSSSRAGAEGRELRAHGWPSPWPAQLVGRWLPGQLLPWVPARRFGLRGSRLEGRSESSCASHAAPSRAGWMHHSTELSARPRGNSCSALRRIPLRRCPQAPPATVTKEENWGQK